MQASRNFYFLLSANQHQLLHFPSFLQLVANFNLARHWHQQVADTAPPHAGPGTCLRCRPISSNIKQHFVNLFFSSL
ncbi:hypothetical protein GQ55_8G103800 [Panicum hallii var. hallii]|uniref:Uncharacterized protein n=1 Tax=Panicum hallii var. hallii TaxID=1504633 RepID=A0A2T7CMC9_9POAL|nr:hypothetical protein GQ55_8G103800 [Panicum hallii var. hallii]